MKRLFLILITMAISNIATSQETDYYSIIGTVVDKQTGEQMSQVNARVKGNSISNITNKDGFFNIKVPIDVKVDTIIFSYVGYKSVNMAVSDINAMGKRDVIALQVEPLTVDDLTVSRSGAAQLVNEAYDLIGQNYNQDTRSMTAFYREMISKGNNYATITEAVLDLNKAPYSSPIADRTAIYKGRGWIDSKSTDTLFIKFQGGISSALTIDLVKNPEEIFTEERNKNYDFSFGSMATIDDKPTYVVNFNQRKGIKYDILCRGNLYIDSTTKAIVRAEFNLNVEGNSEASHIFIRRKPAKVKIDVLSAQYVIAYRNVGQKWHFDYSSTKLDFRCKWENKIFRNNYTIFSEMAVTEHGDEGHRVPYAQRVKETDITLDKVSSFSDDLFWEDYNIIEPEQSIENIVRRIIRQLKK